MFPGSSMKNAILEKCKTCGIKVGWVEFFASLALGVFKLFIGITSNSHALIGAALYSVQDMISAGIIISSIRYSTKDVDDEHPYGYGKIEFIASVLLSGAVMVGAAFLLVSAGKTIFAGTKLAPGWLAFWAAVVAFISNWLLYHYSLCAGTTLHSPAIISNAEHTKGDMMSSGCVAVGVFFAKMGVRHIDPLIAIVEVAHIVKVTVSILRRGIRGLMDTSLPDGEVDLIRNIVAGTKGVEEVISLKSRELGQQIEIYAEIQVAPDLRVAESELIVSAARSNLLCKLPNAGQIHISVAPYWPDFAKERGNRIKVRKVLEKYYRQSIKKHHLKIYDGRIELSLDFFPKVSLSIKMEICRNIREEIKMGIQTAEVSVRDVVNC